MSWGSGEGKAVGEDRGLLEIKRVKKHNHQMSYVVLIWILVFEN